MNPKPPKPIPPQQSQLDEHDPDNWQRVLIGGAVGAAVVLVFLLLLLIFLLLPDDSDKAQIARGGGDGGDAIQEGEGGQRKDDAGQGDGGDSGSNVPAIELGTGPQSKDADVTVEDQPAESVPEPDDVEEQVTETKPPPDARLTVERLTFKPLPKPTGSNGTGGGGSGLVTERGGGLVVEGKEPLTNLFEIPDEVETVVYVIDKSGSMDTADRLVRVKAELIAGIQALNPDQRFSVVFFDSHTWPMFSTGGIVLTPAYRGARSSGTTRLLPAEDSNKQRAIDWINTLDAGGGTEPLGAMALAMKVTPDLIMFLSDGEFDTSYVRQITATNQKKRSKSARIDCIGLGETVYTLQSVARQNDGTYYQAR